MYFTEDQIQEMRTRLPLANVTVVDSLSSDSASRALSANQGRLLDGRVTSLESISQAISKIQTVYQWLGQSGIKSMTTAPEDTPSTLANARSVYELKQITDSHTERITTIEGILSNLDIGGSGSSGGGGGGSNVQLINNVDYYTLIVNSSSVNLYSKQQVDDLLGESPGGGFIGATAVTVASGTTDLKGIINLFLTGKIYFGSDTSAPYLEYDSSHTQFHFNKGVYSNENVTAHGVGTGGGGGGSASTLPDLGDVYDNLNTGLAEGHVLWYSGPTDKWKSKKLGLADLDGVNSPLSPDDGQSLVYDGSSLNKWVSKKLGIADLDGIPALTSTGYLKYDTSTSQWSLASSTNTVYVGTSEHDTSIEDISLTNLDDGQVLVYDTTLTHPKWVNKTVPGISTMYLGSTGHTTSLTGDVSISNPVTYDILVYGNSNKWVNTQFSIENLSHVNVPNRPETGQVLMFQRSGSYGYWYAANGGGGSGINTWRPIQVYGTDQQLNDSTSPLVFKSGTGISLSLSSNVLTIENTGGGSGSSTLEGLRDVVSGSTTYGTVGDVLTLTTVNGEKKWTSSAIQHQTLYDLTVAAAPDSSSISLGKFSPGSANKTIYIPTSLDNLPDGSTRALSNYVLNSALKGLSFASGTFSSTSYNPTGSSGQSVNIPTTLDHISDGTRMLPNTIDVSIGGSPTAPEVSVALRSGSTSISSDSVELPVAGNAIAGIVNTTTQMFGGAKTFINNVTCSSKLYIGGTDYYFEKTSSGLVLYCNNGNGTLYVNGNIVATGAVTAHA